MINRFPFFLLFLALLATVNIASAAPDEPIAPEQAFAMSGRMLNADTIEVTFDIAEGYYLYGDKFRFYAEPESIVIGTPERRTGQMKNDPYFGMVEVLRGKLQILLPLEKQEDITRFKLTGLSQGCWDGGICYPITEQVIDIDTASSGSKSLLNNVLLSDTGNPGSQSARNSDNSLDEAGRIARLAAEENIWLVLATVFGLGLLLALTPCVFPMIPILSGIIVGQGHAISKGKAFALSLAYVLGMALTYAIVGVIAGLSGSLLSNALQNAWVLSACALVFIVLAFSMFGFYQIRMPVSWQTHLNDTASKRTEGGKFIGVSLMGMLSALVVSPCVVAPLAGLLVYIAQTGNALFGGIALFVLALGMGFPLLLIAVFTRAVLPRPGMWMKGVQYTFGVILLGVALWIVSPVLPPLANMMGWALLLIFSGVFLRAFDALPAGAGNGFRFCKGAGIICLIAGICIFVGGLAGATDPLRPFETVISGKQSLSRVSNANFVSVASSEELDSYLGTTDQVVMLDFYADWCTSCKEMERSTFSAPPIHEKMNQMLLLKADVTENTSDHKALLKRFGLFGPPGILFFDKNGNEIKGLKVIGYMSPEDFEIVLDRALAQ